VRHTAPTHQEVNLQMSGPEAVQAVSVVGNQIDTVHAHSQGSDPVSLPEPTS
jgi:hypothetical protein